MDIFHPFNPRRHLLPQTLACVLAVLAFIVTISCSNAAEIASPDPHAGHNHGAGDPHGGHGEPAIDQTALKSVRALGGTVTNGATKRPVAGVTVQLVRPNMGNPNAEKIVQSTRSSANGSFYFPFRPGKSEQLLVVRALWQDFPYDAIAYVNMKHASALNFKLDPAHIELPVYDVAKTDPGLRFQAHHVAIESKPGGLECTESILVENPTGKTFIGKTHEHLTLSLKLPAAAQNVKLSPEINDARLVKDSSGYRIAKIIPPTEYQSRNFIAVSYHIPWSGMPWARSVDLSHTVAYPTTFFFVARPETESALKVTGTGISPDELTQLPMGETTETRIVNTFGKPHGSGILKSGTVMPIRVSRQTNPMFWGFLTFLAALCAGVPLVLRQTRGSAKQAGTPVQAEDPATTPASVSGLATTSFISEKTSLLAQQIAQLDERMKDGTVTPDEYKKQRSLWKQELVQLLKQAE